jgi:hypothetical protein
MGADPDTERCGSRPASAGRDSVTKQAFGAAPLGNVQRGFAKLIHAMDSKDVRCQINSNGYDCHKFPFRKQVR